MMMIFTFSLLPTTALADDPQPAAAEIELRQSDVNNEGTLSLESGKNYKLMENIDITKQIVINGTVTLDLNGYVLRQTGKSQRVIEVESGTFTLKDTNPNPPAHYFTVEQNVLWKYVEISNQDTSGYKKITGGVITGGECNYPDKGGGVQVGANDVFNMEGGNIVGCVAYNAAFGGGVYNEGTFKMKGGSIKGCFAFSGSGVSNKGEMNIGGDSTKTVTITNNKNYENEADNVYLYTDKAINVVGEMNPASRIGISSEKTDFGTTVVTGVKKLTNPLTIFSSDDGTVLEVDGDSIKLSHEHQWGPYVVGNGTEISSCKITEVDENGNGIQCSAKRSRAFEMPTGTATISGSVQDKDGNPIGSATVSLMQGDRQLYSVPVNSGSYTISGVPAGVYNLVVQVSGAYEYTVTTLVEVSSDATTVPEIILPNFSGETSDAVSTKSFLNVVTPNDLGHFSVIVGGLDKYKQSPTTQDSITMNVTKKNPSEASSQMTGALAGKTIGLLLNFDIQQTRSGSGGSTFPVTNTGKLLTIRVELPEELQGKSEYVVYREHSSGTGGSSDGVTTEIHTLKTNPNTDGERIELSSDGKYLTIYAKLFSAYAIAYTPTGTPTPSPGGGGTSSVKRYTIEATAQANGSISPDGNVKVRKGKDKTFTITPDAGYEIARVLVDGDNVGAVDTYTFENVRKNHTIEAFFAATGDDIGGMDEPEGLIGYLPDGLNHTDHIAYVHGYEDGTVRPESPITRAETAMMLYQLLTEERLAEIQTTEHSFSDMDADDWYCEAVATMANGGYIMGYEDGTFGGNRPITRAEFVAILVRFIGAEDVVCNFADVPDNHWAYRYIATATEAGWIAGFEDGTFRPDQSITRAEVMAIINRALNRGVNAESELLNFKSWPDNFANRWYYYDVIEATNGHDYTGHRPSEDWTKLF